MRTLDKFYALLNDYRPFEHIDTDVEVWRKVEEIITITKPIHDNEADDELIATEKLLLRTLISYVTKYQPENEWTFSTICYLLRAHSMPSSNSVKYISALTEVILSLEDGEAFCVEQFVGAQMSKKFDEAIVCLLNRLTILEILEKEPRKQEEFNQDKIIME
jgi:hypothetical protein